jgi:hypothetical protein
MKMSQLEKLKELRKNIEEAPRLVDGWYRSSTDGCMCAVGHVLKITDQLDKIVSRHNGAPICSTRMSGILNTTKIKEELGLTLDDLEGLQRVNDSDYGGIRFMNKRRKEAVLLHLDSIILGMEAINANKIG